MSSEQASPLLPAVVFLGAAVLSVPLAKRLRLGAVLGYLAAGILIGPQVLRLISDAKTTLALSEIGVVLLLFVLGLELSLARLWVMRKLLFGLGAAQMLISTLVLAVCAWALGLPLAAALIAGFGLALSSTAFILQILAERDELADPHGRAAFGVLLFQDLLAIPIIALIPLFGMQASAQSGKPFWQSALTVVAAITGVIVAGRYLLRPVFRMVAASKLTEMFTAASLLVVLGTALLMHEVGLSMGLGAFLAGVLLADSEYSHEIEGHIEPFKGLLLGLFFMAVGMNLDLQLLFREPLLILGIVLAAALLQVVLIWGIGRLFGYVNRNALLLAALLASGGEFAFVVFSQAELAGLLDARNSARLNVVVAIAMAITPLLVLAVEWLAQRSQKPDAPRAFDEIDAQQTSVIICGFGRVGQIPSRVLAAQKIPFTVIDPNMEQVDLARRFGGKIYYGDTTRPETLRAAKLEQAKVLVLALEDPDLALRTARVALRINPSLKIIARARNRQHAFKLMDLGIEDSVRETFHSALLMTHRVLEEIGFSSEVAADRVRRFQLHDEQSLREQHLFYDNESSLIQSAEQNRANLERLFEGDRQT